MQGSLRLFRFRGQIRLAATRCHWLLWLQRFPSETRIPRFKELPGSSPDLLLRVPGVQGAALCLDLPPQTRGTAKLDVVYVQVPLEQIKRQCKLGSDLGASSCLRISSQGSQKLHATVKPSNMPCTAKHALDQGDPGIGLCTQFSGTHSQFVQWGPLKWNLALKTWGPCYQTPPHPPPPLQKKSQPQAFRGHWVAG